MSFLFGGNNSQPPQSKPFGLQDQMTSNQQQAMPVAYLCGTRRIAAKWFTPIYNIRSQKNESNSKKGGKK